MGDQLLTTQEAADYLGVSASFLDNDRWRGSRIPYARIGRRTIRYRQADLDQYIEDQMYESTSEYEDEDYEDDDEDQEEDEDDDEN